MKRTTRSSSSTVTRRSVVEESIRQVSTRQQTPMLAEGSRTDSTRVVRRQSSGNSYDSSNQLDLSELLKEDYFDRLPKTDYTYGDSGSYRPDRIGHPWRSPNLSRRGIHTTSYADASGGRNQYSVTTTFSESLSRTDKSDTNNNSNTRTPDTYSRRLHTHGKEDLFAHQDYYEKDMELRSRHLTSSHYDKNVMDWNSNVNNSSLRQKETPVIEPAARRISLWRATSEQQTSTNKDLEEDEENTNSNASENNSKKGKQNSKVTSIFGLDGTNKATTSGRVTRSRSRRTDVQEMSDEASSSTTNIANSNTNYSEHNHVRTYQNYELISTCTSKMSSFVVYVKEKTHRLQTWCYAPHPLLIPLYLPLLALRYVIHIPCLVAHSLRTSGLTVLPGTVSTTYVTERREQLTRDRQQRVAYSYCWPCFFCILFILFLLLLFLLLFSTRKPLGYYSDGEDETIIEKTLWVVCDSCIKSFYHVGDCLRGIGYFTVQVIKYMANSGVAVYTTTKNFMLWQVQSERDSETVIEPTTGDNTGKSYDGSTTDPRIDKIIKILNDHSKRMRSQESSLQQQRIELDKLIDSIANSKKDTKELMKSVNQYKTELNVIQIRTKESETIIKELHVWRTQLSDTVGRQRSSSMPVAKPEVTLADLKAIQALVERLEKLVREESSSTKADLKRHEASLRLLVVAKGRDYVRDTKGTKPSDSTVKALADELAAGHTRLATLESQHEKLQKVLETLEKRLVETNTFVKESKTLQGSGKSTSGFKFGFGSSEFQIRQLIKEALDIFAADRIARPDFALESAGGSIVGTRCTQTYTDRPAVFSLFGIPLFRLSRSPRSVIQPAVQPGECWAFRGSKGQVVVRLSNPIVVSAITLEHIPASLSPNGRIDSAPREFEVRGIESESDYEGWSLGQFEYQSNASPLQTFDVVPEDSNKKENRKKRPAAFRFVELRILSNHGHPEYTCVYRFRVHGDFLDDTKSR